ncbi:MAG: glycosyltransferase family 2 protein [Sulfitobacter sp.]
MINQHEIPQKGSITVIVATFNRANYLTETLNAIFAQTREVAQIIVWNDGSTDSTESVIEQIVADNPHANLMHFHGRNKGKSAALNQAMKHATGDYIWICDDDDIARPDAVERMAKVLDTQAVGVVGGRHQRFTTLPDGTGKQFLGTGYWPDLRVGSPARHIFEDVYFFQNAALVRRSCYSTVGPFREDIKRSIDYEMFVRLALRFPIAIIDDILFEQRKHEGLRGPATDLHDPKQSEIIWQKNDSLIFADLRDSIPLSFYQSFFDIADTDLSRRVAFLQRGCVYARKNLWSDALADFQTGLTLAPDIELTADEKAIAIRTMAGKSGNATAYSGETRRALLDLRNLGPVGKSFAKHLARASIWRLREALTDKKFSLATKIVLFCAQTGLARRRKDTNNNAITERRVLSYNTVLSNLERNKDPR